MSEPLLKVENLVQHFPVSRTYTVKAVNGVSFNIYPGETYGLVGESGSGKTTIGRSIIRLYNPTDGRITFNGKVISGALDRDTRSMLRSDMQMIFQDPMASSAVLSVTVSGRFVTGMPHSAAARTSTPS